jgi:hypothetical protein
MFQNAKRGVSRWMILATLVGALAVPAVAQTRKVALPEFQTVKGLAVLSGPEGPSLTQIAALLPPSARLKPLSPDARGVLRLAPLPTSAAPRLQGKETAQTAANQPLPEDLPRAVQSELKRIGCYSGGIDGDWGNGSRRAMERFYAAKKLEKGEVEPTEVVWRSLLSEAEGTCKAEVATKKATTKKTTTKKTTTKQTTTTKKPSGGGSPSCKFIGIAIICS